MRIDDNERREVAKKLRNLDVRKYDAYRLAGLIDRPIANEMGESCDL